jgi:hypothetical protein
VVPAPAGQARALPRRHDPANASFTALIERRSVERLPAAYDKRGLLRGLRFKADPRA